MTIGIDLGTTNSCMAAVIDGKPQVIPNAQGHKTTPSVIFYGQDGKAETGDDAKSRKVRDPEQTVWSVKRFMGKSFTAVKGEKDHLPYHFTCNEQDEICVSIRGRRLTVPEISGQVLSKLRTDASARLGQDVTEAVITVPAYFSDAQREATREAGERYGGLKVRRIISEPTAAALAYGFGSNENRTIAVYDLGGGTFDISILRIEDGSFSVLSTSGDTMLGGDDIDRRISDWILREAKRQTREDVAAAYADSATRSAAAYAMQAVRDAAEKAKIELSSSDEARILIPRYYNGTSVDLRLSRKNLENMISYVTDATFKCCDIAMKAAGFPKLDAVVLVGGSTKSPCVRKAVAGYFGLEPDTSVNPDEAVALGAAIMASVLDGQMQGAKLLDVIPMDLGIQILKPNGKRDIAVVMKANTRIAPGMGWQRVFSTTRKGVGRLDFQVMQGLERIGRFSVDISGLPKGDYRIPVTFAVDENGILTVLAGKGIDSKAYTFTKYRAAQSA